MILLSLNLIKGRNMATEKQLQIFKSFLEGNRFNVLGAIHGLTGSRISQICIEVSIELFSKYKHDGSVAGRYKGRTKHTAPFVNSPREMRQYKQFWLNLIEPKNTDGLSKTPDLNSPVFGFNGRIQKALEANGINTVEDLINLSQSNLEKFKGIGHTSIDKIKHGLANNGLTLKDNVRNYTRYPIRKTEAIEILHKKLDHRLIEKGEPDIVGQGENATVHLSGTFTKAELLAYVFFFNEKNKKRQ